LVPGGPFPTENTSCQAATPPFVDPLPTAPSAAPPCPLPAPDSHPPSLIGDAIPINIPAHAQVPGGGNIDPLSIDMAPDGRPPSLIGSVLPIDVPAHPRVPGQGTINLMSIDMANRDPIANYHLPGAVVSALKSGSVRFFDNLSENRNRDRSTHTPNSKITEPNL
jgi:hypothetical protein